ncbi:MAG: hypothetical protein ACD_3C00195G0004 [uncultured bacterium (gcode 4)]|uniref:LamG-like jellyroll fold domain-containing protein n=1 Tax=uncultured bacterium (gcode 4) TaxID=1234023 RepID=K2GW31_9BACT|nr:MAG: hypothetical protein ACD_3C00195G0004 [uncultured bacterium (gcode 4)]
MNSKIHWLDFKKAFTLVELIVVIVILAILATIAFLSFSSQSAWARDSTRLADMSNIAKWLSVNYGLAGKYPIPDDNISIMASWASIWLQWYAWNTVLNVIKLSAWWKDPLDSSTYYTYSVNAGQSKFQLLGFLEDWNSSALSLKDDSLKLIANNFKPLADVFADPNSYSGRYVYTKWDILGVLLDGITKVPVQAKKSASFTWVDIVNATWSYAMQFDNKIMSSWTWSSLTYWYLTYKQKESWLVWYWNFDEKSWNTINDTSWNNNNWTLSWLLSWSWWKVWSSLFLSWWYVLIPDSKTLDMKDSLTVTSWINSNSWTDTDRKWIFINGHAYYLTVNPDWNVCVYAYWKNPEWYHCDTNVLSLNSWQFIWMTISSQEFKIYVNWANVKTFASTWSITKRLNSSTNAIWSEWNWNKRYYNWLMDELRIYNRALWDSEILSLYDSTK